MMLHCINPDTLTVEWSNGADFAPEFLYELAQQQSLFSENYAMTTLTEKLAQLPPNLVQEVDDFVDFLVAKHHPFATHHNEQSLAELGMESYLANLEQYENLLAEGKIQW